MRPDSQSGDYHHFVDQRAVLAVPNALNVASSLGFLVRLWRAGSSFVDARERWPYAEFS
ncbi:hypothetical protein [Lacisediminimonas profundi]|uniref:hypothetical protein n=1 Tax=Lacisediminimonas profundi TaxID=2603856 RepID=UPI0013875B50|nr:hypothetical protein [Lacisediminimonas profundi]